MPHKGRATLSLEGLTALFEADLIREDYGVHGSPTWLQPENVRLVSLEVLGQEMPLKNLPDAIEAALLEEADNLEWETE